MIKIFFWLSLNKYSSCDAIGNDRSMIILDWSRILIRGYIVRIYVVSFRPSPSMIGPNFAHRCVFCKSESRFQNHPVVPERCAHAANRGPTVAEIMSFWASPTFGPIGLAGQRCHAWPATLCGGPLPSHRTGALHTYGTSGISEIIATYWIFIKMFTSPTNFEGDISFVLSQ